MKDLLDDDADGRWVCSLEAALGLELLQEVEALRGAASAALRQSCKTQKAAGQQLTTVLLFLYVLDVVGGAEGGWKHGGGGGVSLRSAWSVGAMWAVALPLMMVSAVRWEKWARALTRPPASGGDSWLHIHT